MSATHLEKENYAWTVNVGDHPARADSPGYTRSRKLMIALLKLTPNHFYGGGLQNRPLTSR